MFVKAKGCRGMVVRMEGLDPKHLAEAPETFCLQAIEICAHLMQTEEA